MSMSRFCEIFKATDSNYYLDLAANEYGEREQAQTYGPFVTEQDAEDYLDNFSNPGSIMTDQTGTRAVPTVSPNGRKVQAPERNGGWW